MRRFLVLRQREPVIGPFNVDGLHVEYLNAMPMFESEIPEMDRMGAEGFLLELQRQGIGFWNCERKAIASSDITGH